jgi:peptide/nickel transport system substrate-binding protein
MTAIIWMTLRVTRPKEAFMMLYPLYKRAGLVLGLLVLLLSACAPSSPTPTTVAPTAATPAVVPTVTPVPVATPQPTATPTVADAIIIGLLQDREPDSLWPFGTSTEEQRVVQAAVMEPPMTTLGYDYQPVLFEEIPTLENGGAVLTQTRVFIDPATGVVTTTDTGVVTTTTQIRMVYTLRPDLYWSDGQPVKASDSVFGFNVACSPDSGYADYTRCERIERYEALDDRTIRVTFRPNVQELDYFTYYWDFLPEHAWSGYTVEEMATTERTARMFSPSYGPYMVEEWLPGERITLVRNPYYVFHGEGYPVVNKIIFKFLPDAYDLLAQLVAGQIDLVEHHSLQSVETQLLIKFEENGLLRLYSHPDLLWENIVFNLNDPADLSQPHPVLSDLRVRKALAYAMNRAAMVDNLYYGWVPVLNSWIPSEHWAYPGDAALTLYPYEPTTATLLLEDAGWVLADDGYRYKDGTRLNLTLYILAGQPLREAIVQYLQNSVAPLGVEVTVVRVREEEWYSENSPLTRRAFDLIEFAWTTGIEPDGQVAYTCGEIPSEATNWRGQNYGGWCNSIATTALLATTRELGREQRKEYYRLAQEQFTDELPALPLFSRLDLYAATPGLTNLSVDPTEVMTWNCWEWSLAVRK